MQLEIGDRLAPLIGAAPGEVIISDSTSVNVQTGHGCADSAAGPGHDRHRQHQLPDRCLR